LEFCNGGGAQKLEWCPYHPVQKNFTAYTFVYV